MNTILKNLLEFADRMGVVDQMLCYDHGFITLEGRTRTEEKKFKITLSIEEEEKNAEELE